jgi:plasmid stability protein
MSTQTLMLPVPDGLLARIRDRARQANRTVEAEVLDVLSAALTANAELPADLSEAVAALHLLDEPALRRAADTRLPAEASAELEALHFKQRREGLTEVEERARQDLVRQYERALLVRAEATALLHGRGRNGTAPAAP